MIYRKSNRAPISPCHSRFGAFTLVETVICIVITSVMLAAALSTVSAARVGMYKITERQRGELLAQELMSEILILDYSEPDGDTTIGTDTGEVATDRTTFDDVDDYHNWTASPPEYRDGTAIPSTTGWNRKVEVVKAVGANLTVAVGGETGIKVIAITVSHNGVPAATLTAVRTSAL